MSRAFALLLLVCVAVAGCRNSREPVTAADATHTQMDIVGSIDPDTAGARRAETGVVFNPNTIDVGDTVAGLTVSQVSLQTSSDGNIGGTVRFSGLLELSGKTILHPDYPEVSVCFESDSSSTARMPRWVGDRRRAWFCFHGGERTDALSSGVLKEAKIVIDAFTIYRGRSDQVNEAHLVSVRL